MATKRELIEISRDAFTVVLRHGIANQSRTAEMSGRGGIALCDAMEADMGESPQAVAAQIGERLRAAGKLPLDAVAEAWRIIYASEVTVSQKADLHKEIMTLIRREVYAERERTIRLVESGMFYRSEISDKIRSGE